MRHTTTPDYKVHVNSEEFISFISSVNDKYFKGSSFEAKKGRYVRHVGGTRYLKLAVMRDDDQPYRVYCFIDAVNGDVLKAASWKAPAKHPRSNIFDNDNGLSGVDNHGAVYLR